MAQAWYAQTTEQVLAALNTSPAGLSLGEAAGRLARFGQNRLPETKAPGWPVIFFRQFRNPLIYLLLAVGVVLWFTDSTGDAVIILLVLLFNALVGAAQEGRAQNTLRALKNFTQTQAVVLRGGQERVIDDTQAVAGDVVVLREGDKVPADCRLIGISNLQLDESALTGESLPVSKVTEPLAVKDQLALPAAEQKNMVFKGTMVVAGSGLAVTTATGPQTVVGRISRAIAQEVSEIPLQAEIRRLSKIIIWLVAGLSLILFVYGFYTGRSAAEMFSTVIALSVSMIPEGLPMVLTLVLAQGVWRMGKRNALVKRLQAVEALGQAQVIAVDKTGTLTQNRLVAKRLLAGGKEFEISGDGYEPKGEIYFQGQSVEAGGFKELQLASLLAALSANASVFFNERTQAWEITGDPIEAAILVLAEKLGAVKKDLEIQHRLAEELEFDHLRQYQAKLYSQDKGYLLIVSGAPEAVIALCGLSLRAQNQLLDLLDRWSRQGLRVVAYAYKKTARLALKNILPQLEFGGFFGMRDVLHAEVPATVRGVTQAGIRVVMITGDYPLTAEAIAREAGIYKAGDKIMLGSDLDGLSDAALAQSLDRVSVFARVSPERKLRIVKAYKARGEIIGMTGDGVNDAPSLVAADLGIAMGRAGTEVAKEAADIVLLDDNFRSIAAAVEEGRKIYQIIKRVLLYLFSTNFGEVLTVSGALFLNLPLPLLPVQLIWLNFVTDGFFTFALAVSGTEYTLNGSFDRPGRYLIDKLMVKRSLLMSLVMAAGALFLFKQYLQIDPSKALSVSLTLLAVFQWFNALNCASRTRSVFLPNLWSNLALYLTLPAALAVQLLGLYLPFLQKFLHTRPLSFGDWLLVAGTAGAILLVEEIRKAFARMRTQPQV